jgi:hypothetical protein
VELGVELGDIYSTIFDLKLEDLSNKKPKKSEWD